MSQSPLPRPLGCPHVTGHPWAAGGTEPEGGQKGRGKSTSHQVFTSGGEMDITPAVRESSSCSHRHSHSRAKQMFPSNTNGSPSPPTWGVSRIPGTQGHETGPSGGTSPWRGGRPLASPSRTVSRFECRHVTEAQCALFPPIGNHSFLIRRQHLDVRD